MIIALDHVAIAVPDFEAAIKFWQESSYTTRFIAPGIPNPSMKKPFMQEWSASHDLALLTHPERLPVEVIAYAHAPQGESAMNFVPESARVYQHTTNPEETITFWKRFGFQQVQTDDGDVLLRWQSALAKVPCEIELRPVVEGVECLLDTNGINSLAFLSSNAKQERERLIKEGCRVTDIESLEVNGKKLDLFFAIGPQGEMCEVISPSIDTSSSPASLAA